MTIAVDMGRKATKTNKQYTNAFNSITKTNKTNKQSTSTSCVQNQHNSYCQSGILNWYFSVQLYNLYLFWKPPWLRHFQLALQHLLKFLALQYFLKMASAFMPAANTQMYFSLDFIIEATIMDPDKTAPMTAVWSGSIMLTLEWAVDGAPSQIPTLKFLTPPAPQVPPLGHDHSNRIKIPFNIYSYICENSTKFGIKIFETDIVTEI